MPQKMLFRGQESNLTLSATTDWADISVGQTFSAKTMSGVTPVCDLLGLQVPVEGCLVIDW